MTQDGGYDVEFVAEPTFETSCSICLLTLKEPVQVNSCGHRFCKGCIKKLRRRTKGPIRCPNDQRIIKKWFQDNAVKRDILNLIIKCKMHNEGCVWEGEIRHFENHLKICDFFEIPCDNKDCKQNMERRKLIIHLQVCQYRIVKCNFCSEGYVFNNKKNHEDKCIVCPLICPNECGTFISRYIMDVHINIECPNTIHPCKYMKIGCQIKGTWSELDQHLEDATNKHLSQAVECIDLQKDCISQQNDRISQQNDRISQQNDRISQQNYQIELLFQKVFDTKPLDLPVKPYTFPINYFHQKFESAKQSDELIYSDTFYCLNGYRVRFYVYLNGSGDGHDTHVSLFFQIMKGPFDNMLDWPFKGIVKFSVQGKRKKRKKMEFDTTKVPQNDFYQKPTSEENPGLGFTTFIKHDVIEDYETDDTLIITCQVERVKC